MKTQLCKFSVTNWIPVIRIMFQSNKTWEKNLKFVLTLPTAKVVINLSNICHKFVTYKVSVKYNLREKGEKHKTCFSQTSGQIWKDENNDKSREKCILQFHDWTLNKTEYCLIILLTTCCYFVWILYFPIVKSDYLGYDTKVERSSTEFVKN